MEIRYTNTLADSIKFNLHWLRAQPLTYIILVAMCWPFYTAWQKTEGTVFHLIALVFIMAALLLSMGFLALILVVIVAKLSKGVLTEHRIFVSDTGLIEETDANRTEYKWSDIKKISQNRQYIFIFNSWFAAHVVPKHAFADPFQAEAFYNSAHGWWQASGTSK